MARIEIKEQALNFNTFLKGSDALTKRIGRNRFSPYKLVLFVHDLIVLYLAIGLGFWTTGFTFFPGNNVIESIILFILLLIVIAFFPNYDLYSYHLIFLKKNHLLNLIRSLCWGFLTLGFIPVLYMYSHVFGAISTILLMFLAGIGLLLLSRYFWNYLLNLLKSFGMGFLAIGLFELSKVVDKSVLVEHWFAIPMGFSVAVAMILVTRGLLVHVVFDVWMRRHFRRQVLIVGSDQEAKKIIGHIVAHNAPFWVAGFVSAKKVSNLGMSVSKDRLGELRELPFIIERQKIDEIIVTDQDIEKTTLISMLDYCTSKRLTVWLPPKLMPIIDLKLNTDSFCGLSMIKLCSQKNSYIFNKIKNGLDALVVLPMMLLFSLLFLIIGVAVKLSSQGPVFYKPRAVGRNGETFTLYKFRSMRIDKGHEAHRNYVTKLIKGEISQDSGKGGVFKMTDDQRITSVGKLLRKLSLDELPQLINILKGEMSFVGPRPCLPYEYELYKDWHKNRLFIRPGLTGIWQVAGRSSVSFEDMVLLDLYYIYNRSLLMDLNILFETIFAVLKKQGAH